MSTQPIPRLTVDQYLEIERKAEFKSEFIDGEVFTMSAASLNHALIATALLARLFEQLRKSTCTVAGSDLRLYCERARILTYPDAVVFCEPARFKDKEQDTLVDATVIVEVLSPSTQNYDRGEKFRAYRNLPSFTEYLLIEQKEVAAEHHVRQPDGSWLMREWSKPDTILDLKSIDCSLRLGDPYLKARF
jgi:Uma2 family endonuclease